MLETRYLIFADLLKRSVSLSEVSSHERCVSEKKKSLNECRDYKSVHNYLRFLSAGNVVFDIR